MMTASVAPIELSAKREEQIKSATSFCLVAKPFHWNVQDTDDTIIQAKQHNAVGKALKCPGFSIPKT